MSWSDINNWVYGLVTALIAGVIALIRKVLTNEKQIQLLEADIKRREEYNQERFEEIKIQLTEVKQDIKELIRSK